MKIYPEITPEQESAIRDLFYEYSDADFVFKTTEDGYRVNISQMYNYVSFVHLSYLQGLSKMAEILNCSDGDENKYSYGGCPTCDYGSSYTVEYKFQNS